MFPLTATLKSGHRNVKGVFCSLEKMKNRNAGKPHKQGLFSGLFTVNKAGMTGHIQPVTWMSGLTVQRDVSVYILHSHEGVSADSERS